MAKSRKASALFDTRVIYCDDNLDQRRFLRALPSLTEPNRRLTQDSIRGSQNRMKPCLFCGRRESSNEHILADSVWKRMQAGNSTMNVGIWDGVEEKDFRNPHRQESFKTRSVCGNCNKGWMSQLEAEFLELVGSLIEPTWPISANELIERALCQSAVLARWAVKTAITVNLAGISKRLINSQIATDVRANKLPPDLKVLIAFIKKKDIAPSRSILDFFS